MDVGEAAELRLAEHVGVRVVEALQIVRRRRRDLGRGRQRHPRAERRERRAVIAEERLHDRRVGGRAGGERADQLLPGEVHAHALDEALFGEARRAQRVLEDVAVETAELVAELLARLDVLAHHRVRRGEAERPRLGIEQRAVDHAVERLAGEAELARGLRIDALQPVAAQLRPIGLRELVDVDPLVAHLGGDVAGLCRAAAGVEIILQAPAREAEHDDRENAFRHPGGDAGTHGLKHEIRCLC